VDVFLHFFEAKSPGKNLCVNFSGIAGRIILTLFQQSYKGFRGKFFKVCSSEADPTTLDGFPLYWVGELKLKKAKTIEELSSADREVCQVLASLEMVFNTTELIKNEYDFVALTRCIGMGTTPSLPSPSANSVYASSCLSYKLILTLICMACLSHNSFSLVQIWCWMLRSGQSWLRSCPFVARPLLVGLVPPHNQPLLLPLPLPQPLPLEPSHHLPHHSQTHNLPPHKPHRTPFLLILLQPILLQSLSWLFP